MMKKLFALFGAGLMLSACFDDGNVQSGGNLKHPPKLKEAASADKSKATETPSKKEVTTTEVNSSEEKAQQLNKTEATTSSNPPQKNDNVSENPKTETKSEKNATPSTDAATTATKPTKSSNTNTASSVEKNKPAISNATKTKANLKKEPKAESDKSHREHKESHEEKSQESSKVHSKKYLAYNMIAKKQAKEESVSNFSMEELRLGAQRVLTADEIHYQKSQCRYPYMSDQELVQYSCVAKSVITH